MSVLQGITQAFMRPFETSGGDSFEWSVNGSANSETANDGVFACVMTLIPTMASAILFDGLVIYLTSDFKIRISHSSLNVGIPQSALGRILGFTDAIAETSNTVTAQQRPLYCWFPTHHSFDGSRQWRNFGDRFKGAMGASGGKFGVTLPARYKRSFEYSTNYSLGTYSEAERETYTVGSTDYYPSAERSFQEIFDGANTVMLQNDGSGNINPKGIYYIDRAYEYTGSLPTRAIPSTMDAGGIHFDLDDNSKRDNYLFCQIDGDISPPPRTDQRSVSYYQPSFTLASDDTPNTVAWNGSVGR